MLKRSEIQTVEGENKSLRHRFGRQRHFKNATNKLKMDSVIPPFWENPPPDFLGLSGQ